MIPEEEIEQEVQNMGYFIARPRKIIPSFYKLGDGTILKVIVSINHVIQDPRNPNNFVVNSTNLVSSFVPPNYRTPQASAQYPPSELNLNPINDDLEFEVLQENFTTYDFSNRIVISVKPVLAQVIKTRHYTAEGEPIYSVNLNPIIKMKKQN